jgi:HEAT repeats
MDADEYRKQYERELASAGRRRAARPGAEAASLSTKELVAAVKDAGRAADTRIALIDASSAGAVAKPSLMQALIRILRDPAEDDRVRSAALRALQQNSFSRTEFRRYEADYRDALRSAATDDDPQLRDQAMERLALTGDEYVQRLLVDGLQDPSKALVPPQRALQMIGYDVHAEHYPMLRDLVETSSKPAVRRSALRLLAADSEATDLFARIAADKGEDPAARSTSAVALQSLAPDQFDDVARDVVLDDDDDRRVRATFVNAIAHREGTPHADVEQKVRSMAAPGAASGALRSAARQYVAEKGAGS